MKYKRFIFTLLLCKILTVNFIMAQNPAEQTSVVNISLGQRVQFFSSEMKEKRTFSIYVPPINSNSPKRFPVIYVLDGDTNFLQTVSTVSFLAMNDLMPEAIVVGIANTDRIRDLTPKLTKTKTPPPGIKEFGNADKLLAYLDNELIPYIDKNYPTQSFKVLIGHSLGGLFATHAMLQRPNLFKGIITLDPSLWWDERAMIEKAANFFGKNPSYKGRLIMAEGSSTEGWRIDWEKLKPSVPSNLTTELISITNESHETMSFRGQYEALQSLFKDYIPQFRSNDSKATLSALEEQYSALSKEYGYQIDIPDFALLEVAQRNLNRKDFQSAVKTLEKGISIYPASTRFTALLEEAKRGLVNAPLSGSVEKKILRIPAKEGADLIGTWEGTLKTEPGMPVQMALVIENKDEFLSGYMLARGMKRDGGDLRFDISEMRLKGKFFEWDRNERNGGVHVHIAEIIDSNTLKGKVELRDHPPFPEGFTPPVVTFLLKRKK